MIDGVYYDTEKNSLVLIYLFKTHDSGLVTFFLEKDNNNIIFKGLMLPKFLPYVYVGPI